MASQDNSKEVAPLSTLISRGHYRLFHLLQGPSMMKIKLEPYIHLCNNLFFEKETINFTVI